MGIRHAFQSAKVQGADATLASKNEWNADHVIDPATVTLAMMENRANSRVIGRNTAGAGVPEEVTASQLLDWVSNTNGVLLTRAAGTWGTVALVSADNGNLLFLDSAAPNQPGTGGAKFHSVSVAGRSMMSCLSGFGSALTSYQLQPHIGRKAVDSYVALGCGVATFSQLGFCGAPYTGGVLTGRNALNTNRVTQTRRAGFVSGAVAGNISFLTWTPQLSRLWRGNGAGLGGFFFGMIFDISDAVLVGTANTFAGLEFVARNPPTDVAPSTLPNIIGIGTDSGDTQLQLYAAGAAAQARTSLGANFPANTVSTDLYELMLFCAPNDTKVLWEVNRLNTGDKATGTISAAANLPSNTIFATPSIRRSNGGAASSVAFDLSMLYAETDN